MQTKGIVFPRPGEVKIQEMELDHPSRGHVLIKTKLSLISTGTELTALSGKFTPQSAWGRYVKYPFYPGYSNYGVVQEVGEGVEGLRPGDRVVSTAPHFEYVMVSADKVFKVPEGVSDTEAPFFDLACTVINSVRLSKLALGGSSVVVGLGLLGQLACLFSRLAGAFPVIGVDLSEFRLGLARKLGATATLKGMSEEARDAVSSLTKGRMADVVFEVTGNPEAIPPELALLKRQGRLILLSSPRGPTTLDFHDLVNAPSNIIIGTHVTSQPSCETPYNQWTMGRNTELFFDLISGGVVSVKELVSEVRPWEEAKQVYADLLDPFGKRLNAMGILLDFR